MNSDYNREQAKQADRQAMYSWLCTELGIDPALLSVTGRIGKRLRSRFRVAENHLRRGKWTKEQARKFITEGVPE